MSIHIVSGGTGFVGAALILELLQQTDADILCLVRPEKGDIDARLYQSLRNAALAYGYDRHITALAQRRCSALTGNLNASLCGYSPTPALGAVEQFWHCAASLKYEPEHQREIYETNVYGTQRALELAKRLQVQSFNYISTAYVAGKRSGLVREELLEGHATNNLYEDSKLAAEHAVAATTEFHTRIFRPSIIVGHSQTYAVSGSFTGFYALVQHISKLGILSRLQMGDSLTETLHLCADSECPMNVIPVDAVARQMVRIALSSSNASIFHITNSTPPMLGMLLAPIFRAGGVKDPVFVS
jgi:thioester reductase-like protein